MKKAVMLIALFVGFVGFSQEEKEYREDAVELVKLQTEDQIKAMLAPIVERMIPEGNKKAFMKEVESSMEKLYPSLATFYMKSFSHKEINEILEFYNSPIGKKMLAKLPGITQQSLEIGQEWARAEVMPLVQEFQSETDAERGVQRDADREATEREAERKSDRGN